MTSEFFFSNTAGIYFGSSDYRLPPRGIIASLGCPPLSPCWKNEWKQNVHFFLVDSPSLVSAKTSFITWTPKSPVISVQIPTLYHHIGFYSNFHWFFSTSNRLSDHHLSEAMELECLWKWMNCSLRWMQERKYLLAVPLALGVVMVTIFGDSLYSSTRVCNQMALHTVSPAIGRDYFEPD